MTVGKIPLNPFRKGGILEKSPFPKGGPACHCEASLPAKPVQTTVSVQVRWAERGEQGTSGQV